MHIPVTDNLKLYFLKLCSANLWLLSSTLILLCTPSPPHIWRPLNDNIFRNYSKYYRIFHFCPWIDEALLCFKAIIWIGGWWGGGVDPIQPNIFWWVDLKSSLYGNHVAINHAEKFYQIKLLAEFSSWIMKWLMWLKVLSLCK